MIPAYTFHEHDTGEFRVLYYGKPVGIGLYLRQEIEAETICDALNESLDRAHGQGYDEGQNNANRNRMT